MSWRLQGQEKYLLNKEFVKIDILSYKNKIHQKSSFHEHCEFCFEKIENLEVSYCTKDFYRWLCPTCFEDFAQSFNFKEFNYKYFVLNHERKGTYYHEFAFGKPRNEYWNEASIYIDDEIMQNIVLYKIFEENVEKYDYFGQTIIDDKIWSKIVKNLDKYSNEIKEAILEIEEWVKYSLERYKCFSILGI